MVNILFQSLIGLKINWNFRPPGPIRLPPTQFQSLIGLKINWNTERVLQAFPIPSFNP